MTINFASDIEIKRIKAALAKADGFKMHESDDLPDPLSVTDTAEIHIGKLIQHRADKKTLFLAACWDNVTAGSVNAAIKLAEKILA
jgi:aspartate-semialdehyde dehydrogenase